MQIFLETERLLLRQFTPDDVDNLLELDSDIEVRRYLDMPTPPTRGIIAEHTLPRFMARPGRYIAVSRYSGVSTKKRPPEGSSVWGRPRLLVGYCNSTRRVPSGVFTASTIVPATMTTLPTYASGRAAIWAYESTGSTRPCTCGEITEPQATQPSRLANTLSQRHCMAASLLQISCHRVYQKR